MYKLWNTRYSTIMSCVLSLSQRRFSGMERQVYPWLSVWASWAWQCQRMCTHAAAVAAVSCPCQVHAVNSPAAHTLGMMDAPVEKWYTPLLYKPWHQFSSFVYKMQLIFTIQIQVKPVLCWLRFRKQTVCWSWPTLSFYLVVVPDLGEEAEFGFISPQ